MTLTNSIPLLISASCSGLLLHCFAFRRGEWDSVSPTLLLSYAIIAAAGSLILSARSFFVTASSHLVGIWLSMLFYRLFFHRLSRFPGPFAGRLSNLYVTFLSAKNLRLYEETRRLHDKYGDYIRLGPSELSIADPQAIKALYSTTSPVTKGPFYTLFEPRNPLFTIRDRNAHSERRKIWDRAFSTRSLQMYEPRVLKYTLELIDAIEQRIGTPMNMQEWFAFYSFDVMGDITFGKAFNMLSKGEPSPILGTIQTTLGIVFGYLGHLPWAFAVFKKLPIINGKYNEFWKWVANQLDERAANKEAQDDVFWWLLNAHQQGQKTPQDTLDLQGDTFLSIVAGSDPSATALTNIFFHLATNRRLAQEIQNIIDQLPPADYKSLMKLDILDGLINETFRLHPPAPSGTQRVTPPEGMFIGENWIPGNVIVQVPLHTVYLDDRAFDKPLEFRPERWTTHPELVRDKSVFIPFNGGPYACAGKQLALMELRLVVAEVLRRYDFALAPSQTEKSFWAQQKDHYTLAPSPLWLQFTKRARGVR